jgi:hypothetical protein
MTFYGNICTPVDCSLQRKNIFHNRWCFRKINHGREEVKKEGIVIRKKRRERRRGGRGG